MSSIYLAVRADIGTLQGRGRLTGKGDNMMRRSFVTYWYGLWCQCAMHHVRGYSET